MAIDKEKIYHKLKEAIITTEFEPNMRLNEKALINRFKISRTPLREILIRLQAEGLITMVPRVGTLVSSINIRDIREIVELRKELEGFAGALAARRRTQSQLNTFRKIIAEVDEIGNESVSDITRLAKLDVEFHQMLYEAARNNELKRCVDQIRSTMLRYWYHAGFGGQEFLGHFETLKWVLKGLENRDPAATRRSLEAHVDEFVSKLKILFD